MNAIKIRGILATRTANVTILNFSQQVNVDESEFKALNLRSIKGQIMHTKRIKRLEVPPPRYEQMSVTQDWSSVWPGPRTFHPAVVPLPVRQGYVEKKPPCEKFGNVELMKIPNFLHLTPPAIKKQCEALLKFCTPWPSNLEKQKYGEHFPLEVTSSSYCHSSPTIRDILARIVTIQIKLSSLKLNDRARDKFRRLVGDRYSEETDVVTIVTDRCPVKKQNYDYALYLLTALYHESLRKEPWEDSKSDADMECYDWNRSVSKDSVEKIFNCSHSAIPNIDIYSEAVNQLMNEGESEHLLEKYGEAVRKLLSLPSSQPCA